KEVFNSKLQLPCFTVVVVIVKILTDVLSVYFIEGVGWVIVAVNTFILQYSTIVAREIVFSHSPAVVQHVSNIQNINAYLKTVGSIGYINFKFLFKVQVEPV